VRRGSSGERQIFSIIGLIMRLQLRITGLVTLAILGGAVFQVWSAETVGFAGLSRQTGIEAARKRYPHSSIVGRHVYVSDADSHDHVYGIDLSDGSSSGQLRVFFERPGVQRPAYPPCEGLTAAIKKQYGEPSAVQEFAEEKAWNRRVIWRRDGESLSLNCFRMGRQPLFAGELTITPDPASPKIR
jgi:hypothetical protein